MHALHGADQCLGRNATDVDAGATHRAVADERNVRALLGRRDGGGEARRAGPDDGQIVTFAVTGAAIAHFKFPLLSC